MKRRFYQQTSALGGIITNTFKIEYSGLSRKVISTRYEELENIDKININGVDYEPSLDLVLNSKGTYTVKYYFNSQLTNTDRMFSGVSGIEKSDLSQFDASLIKSMDGMYYHVVSLKTVDMSLCDLSNAASFEETFMYCETLVELKMTGKMYIGLGNASYMFNGVYTTGVFYYNPEYENSLVANSIPYNWTKIPV